jgi:hypothetical protein
MYYVGMDIENKFHIVTIIEENDMQDSKKEF